MVGSLRIVGTRSSVGRPHLSVCASAVAATRFLFSFEATFVAEVTAPFRLLGDWACPLGGHLTFLRSEDAQRGAPGARSNLTLPPTLGRSIPRAAEELGVAIASLRRQVTKLEIRR
jgi:hypothetical protein